MPTRNFKPFKIKCIECGIVETKILRQAPSIKSRCEDCKQKRNRKVSGEYYKKWIKRNV